MTQDKQLKRKARELAAETGQSYQSALYQLDPDRQQRSARPSLAQLRAAAEVFRRAWAPSPGPRCTDPADTDADDWYDDDLDGCHGCAWTGDDDRPQCNCADNCTCTSCDHYKHADLRRCRVRVPREDRPDLTTWCGKQTKYTVLPYCLHRNSVTRLGTEGDPAADEHGQVRLGDSIQRHEKTYACSTEHVRALIAADQEYRARTPDDSALSAQNTFYGVETFRYEPDEVDVPGPLHGLRRDFHHGEYCAERVIAATFESSPYLSSAAESLLRAVSWITDGAIEYLEHRERQPAENT